MNKRALFTVSAISLVTTSMSFAIRGDVANAISDAFHITNEQLGFVFSPAFWAFAVGAVASGAVIDLLGMKRLHIISGAGYIVAALLVLLPFTLGIIFVGLWVYYRARGGYKAVRLSAH